MTGLDRAITRVRALRKDAQDTYDEYDVPGQWLDENGCLDGWENEQGHDVAVGRIDTLDEVLELLDRLRKEEEA